MRISGCSKIVNSSLPLRLHCFSFSVHQRAACKTRKNQQSPTSALVAAFAPVPTQPSTAQPGSKPSLSPGSSPSTSSGRRSAQFWPSHSPRSLRRSGMTCPVTPLLHSQQHRRLIGAHEDRAGRLDRAGCVSSPEAASLRTTVVGSCRSLIGVTDRPGASCQNGHPAGSRCLG